MDLDGDPDWDLDGAKHGKVIDNRTTVTNGDKNFNIDTSSSSSWADRNRLKYVYYRNEGQVLLALALAGQIEIDLNVFTTGTRARPY